MSSKGAPGLATAKLLPGAHIVRAFNAIGYMKLSEDAHRPGEPVGVPIAGDDQNAIAIASSLIREIGFEPVARRRALDGQISRSGNAARRRAYAG